MKESGFKALLYIYIYRLVAMLHRAVYQRVILICSFVFLFMSGNIPFSNSMDDQQTSYVTG